MVHLRYYDDYNYKLLCHANDDEHFNIATSIIMIIVVAAITIIIVLIITTIIIFIIGNRKLGSVQIKC